MRLSAVAALSVIAPLAVSAFPEFAGRDSQDWPIRRNLASSVAATRQSSVNKRYAAPYTSQFPYTGAKMDGLPGPGLGGVPVPAPGDYAHYFEPPPPGAQRGPCPGLNTLANHGFLSRDGITNFTELVAAMQNVYNLDYSTAATLSVLGIAYDGDPTTGRLSIGGDATSSTSEPGYFYGPEGGLSKHNTFELDASLTRNDYSITGDDYTFNGTLFGMMVATAASTSSAAEPLFDFSAMSLYRYQRYQQSLAENPMFWFPDQGLHSYGASAFLYEVFPSSSNNYKPDLPTISSFFGAVPKGNTYVYQPERIPANWTNRVTQYTIESISNQTGLLYAAYPVPFGGNDGVGNFVTVNTPYSSAGGPSVGGQNFACAVYLDALAIADASPQPLVLQSFITSKLNPIFAPFNCTLVTPT